LEAFGDYFALLERWNRTINLTSLALDPPSDQAIDRLLLEPVEGAEYVGDSSINWLDVGSGGGSPAIPLKILRPRARLTMVESRSRKAAFLREVIRALGLTDAAVLEDRFEQLSTADRGVDLVTVRAVREDRILTNKAGLVLKAGGRLILFGKERATDEFEGFRLIRNQPLLGSTISTIRVLERVFHVEHAS
jgi:16S rRNA (guanine527-N7)-methyltransferase